MSDHQQKLSGYQDLVPAEIEAINVIKALEAQVLAKLRELQDQPDINPLWLAIGRTDIEKGFMAVTRSIARPQEVRP